MNGSSPARHSSGRVPVRVLLIGLVLACLLPGVIGVSLLMTRIYQDDRAQTNAAAVLAARSLGKLFDAELERARAIGTALATSERLSEGDLAGLHARALSLIESERIGSNVALVDREGRHLLNTLRPFGEALPPHGDPKHLQQLFAKGVVTVSGVYIGGVTGKPVVSVDVPVLRGGIATAAVRVVFQTDHVSALMARQPLPDDWIASITDSSGITVARSKLAERFVGQQASPELLSRLSMAAEGSYEAATREGIPAIVAFTRSPVSTWTVAVAIPKQSLNAEWQRTTLLLGASVLGLFALGAAFAWWQGGRIARSVQRLAQAAVAMADAPPSAASPDLESRLISGLHFAEAEDAAWAIGQSEAMLVQRAQAERSLLETLREREAQLAEAQRLAQLGSWTWDPGSDALTASDGLQEVVGHADLPTLTALGGQQSARTIHFFVSTFLAGFLFVHIAMVIVSGFRERMRAMIWRSGE